MPPDAAEGSQNSQAGTDPDEGRGPSPTSTDTQDLPLEQLRTRLLHYLRAYLNRQVPYGPVDPALYGEIAFASPKTAPPTSWHLTYDDSLDPHRDYFADAIDEEDPQ